MNINSNDTIFIFGAGVADRNVNAPYRTPSTYSHLSCVLKLPTITNAQLCATVGPAPGLIMARLEIGATDSNSEPLAFIEAVPSLNSSPTVPRCRTATSNPSDPQLLWRSSATAPAGMPGSPIFAWVPAWQTVRLRFSEQGTAIGIADSNRTEELHSTLAVLATCHYNSADIKPTQHAYLQYMKAGPRAGSIGVVPAGETFLIDTTTATRRMLSVYCDKEGCTERNREYYFDIDDSGSLKVRATGRTLTPIPDSGHFTISGTATGSSTKRALTAISQTSKGVPWTHRCKACKQRCIYGASGMTSTYQNFKSCRKATIITEIWEAKGLQVTGIPKNLQHAL